MCPGARVAKNEVKLIVVELLRDWVIELEDPNQKVGFAHEGHTFMTARPFPKLKFTPRT